MADVERPASAGTPARLSIGPYRIDPSEPCATCGKPLGADCHADHARFVHFACEHRWLTSRAPSGVIYQACRVCKDTRRIG
jgi:hypothetical protein